MRDKLQEGQLFAYYGGLLNEHRREILRLYYDCDMSLAEISDLQGITRQAVRDVIIRSVAILSEYEQKLGLIEKVKGVVTSLEELLARGNFQPDQQADILDVIHQIKEI